MNFDALKQELSDRGFQMLTDARRGYYINRAAQQLDDMYDWPYKEKDTSGTPPLAIADLGQVRVVVDTTTPTTLDPANADDLLRDVADSLDDTGTADYWYLDQSSGTPTVKTYPVSANTVRVYYYKVQADMSAGISTPAAPARFHFIIVDIAERLASREVGRPDNVSVTQAEIDAAVAVMVRSQFSGQGQRDLMPWGDD